MLYYTFLSPKSLPKVIPNEVWNPYGKPFKRDKTRGGCTKGSITFTGPKGLTILVDCDTIGIPFGIKFGYNK